MARAAGGPMNHISETFPARQLCIEAGKKAVVCFGAAIAIGAALPYSLDFAFQTVTHLGFVVALTEGAVSIVADLLDRPKLAVRMIVEGVETLGASVVLAGASLYVQIA
jgi:hypothetical protein